MRRDQSIYNNTINIGLCQFLPTGNKTKNIKYLVKKLTNTRDCLILLPELFLSNYYHFEPILNNKIKEELQELIQLSISHSLAFVGSLPIYDEGQLYNRCIYINSGKIIGHYNKIRLMKKEKDRFTPGRKSLPLFNYKQTKFTTQICLDLIDPVILAKAVRKSNLDFLLVPYTFSHNYLYFLGKARSLENQIITIVVNRPRKLKDEIEYCGKSKIFLPNGMEQSLSPSKEYLKIVTFNVQDLKINQNSRRDLNIYS